MNRSFLVAAAMGAMALAGCGSGGAARGGPAPGASTAGVGPSPAVKDFHVTLKDVTATCRRSFGASSGDYYARGQPGNSLAINIALQDTVGNRLYRLRESSVLREVVDAGGRNLVPKGEGELRMAGSSASGKPEFLTGGERRIGPVSLSTSVPIDRVPASLAKITGEVALDLVTEDVDRVVPVAPVGEAIEVAPGVTAIVKLLDVEAEASPSSGWNGRASVEVRTAAPTASRPGPIVQTVEVLDGAGGTLATLGRREESTVGATLRRRFSNESGGYGGGYRVPGEKAGAPRTPKSLRFRVFTGVEAVTVPFEFGPVEWGASTAP